MIFPGDLTAAAARIRESYPHCSYDYLATHPPVRTDNDAWRWWGDERFRRGYAAFKYTVAHVLQPRSIVEIGVCLGLAARAFLEACPQARYTGYDNESGVPGSVAVVQQALAGFGAEIIYVKDSRDLRELPLCDLVHVDGCHDYEWAYHDTSLALRAAPWVLVDDARDSQVAAAAFQAVYDWRAGEVEWAHFEDTWTGSILICRETIPR